MLTKEDLQAIAGLLVPIETRIGNLESRFDNLESRFDKLESRFDNLESRFDSLETRVDNFESETKRRFENLEANLRSVDKHVCELDAFYISFFLRVFLQPFLCMNGSVNHIHSLCFIAVMSFSCLFT